MFSGLLSFLASWRTTFLEFHFCGLRINFAFFLLVEPRLTFAPNDRVIFGATALILPRSPEDRLTNSTRPDTRDVHTFNSFRETTRLPAYDSVLVQISIFN